MRIPVSIPGLLRDCTGGHSTVSVEADTLAGAIDALLKCFPLLRVHLHDGAGSLRKHVLVFLNDENVKRLPSQDLPLKESDRLTIVQAVSGGAK